MASNMSLSRMFNFGIFHIFYTIYLENILRPVAVRSAKTGTKSPPRFLDFEMPLGYRDARAAPIKVISVNSPAKSSHLQDDFPGILLH